MDGPDNPIPKQPLRSERVRLHFIRVLFYAAVFSGQVDFRVRVTGDLTQMKCYTGWAVDAGSADTLTRIHGHRNPDHEFVLQARVSHENPRPLSTCRPHKSRILDEFCLNCGDHRKAALRLLHRPPRAGPAKRSVPEIIYDPVALLPVQAGLAGERPVVQINRIKVVRHESESRPHSYQW